MSVSITTDNGTFTAETIAEAQKAERKARKLAEKERDRINALRDVAYVRAQAQAFRIAKWKLRGEETPRGWRFFPHGVNGPHSCNLIAGAGRYDDSIELETENGRGTMDVYRRDYLGYVQNGSGWTIAIVLRDGDGNGDRVHAVGTHEGVVSCELVPGFTSADFRVTNQAESQVA